MKIELEEIEFDAITIGNGGNENWYFTLKKDRVVVLEKKLVCTVHNGGWMQMMALLDDISSAIKNEELVEDDSV